MVRCELLVLKGLSMLREKSVFLKGLQP